MTCEGGRVLIGGGGTLVAEVRISSIRSMAGMAGTY